MIKKTKLIFIFFIMIFFQTKAIGSYKQLAYEFSFKDLDGSSCLSKHNTIPYR